MFSPSIPNGQDTSFAEIKLGSLCLDTLGQQDGGAIGLYSCHGGAGNQVRTGLLVIRSCTSLPVV